LKKKITERSIFVRIQLNIPFISNVCVYAVLGFELGAYTLSDFTPFFVMVFFEVGSPEILARIGFES
jgi:hypothetical protein